MKRSQWDIQRKKNAKAKKKTEQLKLSMEQNKEDKEHRVNAKKKVQKGIIRRNKEYIVRGGGEGNQK